MSLFGITKRANDITADEFVKLGEAIKPQFQTLVNDYENKDINDRVVYSLSIMDRYFSQKGKGWYPVLFMVAYDIEIGAWILDEIGETITPNVALDITINRYESANMKEVILDKGKLRIVLKEIKDLGENRWLRIDKLKITSKVYTESAYISHTYCKYPKSVNIEEVREECIRDGYKEL